MIIQNARILQVYFLLLAVNEVQGSSQFSSPNRNGQDKPQMNSTEQTRASSTIPCRRPGRAPAGTDRLRCTSWPGRWARGNTGRGGHGLWLRGAALRLTPLLPLRLNTALGPSLFICTEGCLTEQHKEGRESHRHVHENDFQSQQTHPKREENGKRYISFLTFFKINARPWRRQPDVFPRAE